MVYACFMFYFVKLSDDFDVQGASYIQENKNVSNFALLFGW